MPLPLFVHIFAGVSVIMNIIVLYLIMQQREQIKFGVTMLLILTITSVIIWVISTYLQMDLITSEDSLFWNAIVSAISNVLAILGVIALTSFAHYFVSPELDFSETLTMIALLFTIAGLKISHVIMAANNDISSINNVQTLADLASVIVLIYAIYLFNRDFRNLLREDLSQKQRKQVNLVYSGLLIGAVGIIPSQFAATFINFELLSIAYITFAAGLVLMIYGYLTDPRVIFILPERTYLAIVVNDHGTFRYSMDFRDTDARDDSAVLISGALKAITSLMSDFYKTEVLPELIKFEDKLILFKWAETFFIAIFCDRDSRLIRSAMDLTAHEIENKYEDNLEEIMYGSKVPNLDDIFNRTFYFIYK